jgi:hypothetical protein
MLSLGVERKDEDHKGEHYMSFIVGDSCIIPVSESNFTRNK